MSTFRGSGPIARHIDAYTDQTTTTAAQALIDLILEDTHTSVAINTFTTNPETNLVFHPGAGWINLNHAPTDNTFIRRLNADETDSYTPTTDIRAYTQGRDATCRWPGCTVPATRCQLDHRIEYHLGGPTSPDNLVNLCQHHHNIKTDRRVHYILDPITGTIAWGPDPRKVDTSGVSYAAWVSVADVSASKSLGARRLHQECRLRVL